MPWTWQHQDTKAPASPGAFSFGAGDPPRSVLRVWPHRSLTRHGFVVFVGCTAALLALPLLAVLGSPILWALLPFLLGALGLLWYFLQRSYRDGELVEELRLWSDRVELQRDNPRAPSQHWDANPHWVRVEMFKEKGPVEDYLTLTGNGRRVEIGAFLSPEERHSLKDQLEQALRGQMPR